ncbi:hypothetical protein HKX48_001319 [Thoreauomyces humboldtii]|nr:hypothetical protein HKX48_001319 [Thoreauomyces humboldtii]
MESAAVSSPSAIAQPRPSHHQKASIDNLQQSSPQHLLGPIDTSSSPHSAPPAAEHSTANHRPAASSSSSDAAAGQQQPLPSTTAPVHHDDSLKHAIATGSTQVVLEEEDRPLPEVLQNIVNFRDVGRNYNADSRTRMLKPGNLFRSGRLDDATTDDLALLTDMFGIRTVIDLRSETEGRMGEDLVNTFPASAINDTHLAEMIASFHIDDKKEDQKDAELAAAKHLDDGDISDIEDDERMSIKTNEETDQKDKDKEVKVTTRVDGNRQSTYYVNFAGRRFRRYSVWKPLSFKSKLKVMSLMAVNQKPKVIRLVGREVINPAGLIGLNQSFVLYCGSEIVHALRLMCVRRNYPLLVHCTQGKDRTGLVIALALWCAKAELRLIVRDYARTQQGLERQRDVMVEEMRKTGLDPVFSDAPADVIVKTFEFIDERFGGPGQYLASHGFGPKMQEKLGYCLLSQEHVECQTPVISDTVHL